MWRRLPAWFVLVAVLFWCSAATAVPTITEPITDNAGVLGEDAKFELDATLREHRANTGVQIAVLTVNTTGGQAIEDYSLAVAEEWGGGARGRDDGVLFVLAISDRTMRLELGYGIEPYMSDAEAKELLDSIRHFLRSGDYDGGVETVVDGVIAKTSGITPDQSLEPPVTFVLQKALAPYALAIFLLLGLVGMLVGGLLLDIKATPDQSWKRKAVERKRAALSSARRYGGAATIGGAIVLGTLLGFIVWGTETGFVAFMVVAYGGAWSFGGLKLREHEKLYWAFYALPGWAVAALVISNIGSIGEWLHFHDGDTLMSQFIDHLIVAIGGPVAVLFGLAGGSGSGGGSSTYSSGGGSSSSSWSSSSSSSSSSGGGGGYSGGGGSFGGGGASSSW